MPELDDDLSVEEAAAELGLTERQVVNLAGEGLIAGARKFKDKQTSPWMLPRQSVLALKVERDELAAAAEAAKRAKEQKRAQPSG